MAKDEVLRPLDEALLLVLHMQPSEIDALDMDDYWHWVGVADRKLTAQREALERLNRR